MKIDTKLVKAYERAKVNLKKSEDALSKSVWPYFTQLADKKDSQAIWNLIRDLPQGFRHSRKMIEAALRIENGNEVDH
jgi:hypothetical protein